MDVVDAKNWLYILQGALTVGILLWTWSQSRSKANKSAIDDLETRLNRHDVQLAQIESSLTAIPQMRVEVSNTMTEMRTDIGKLHARLDDVSGSTHTIEGQMSQMNQSVTMITKHLLDKDN